MNRYLKTTVIALIVFLAVVMIAIAGGVKVQSDITWLDDGSTDTQSDTLARSAGYDTTSAFLLRMDGNTGRGTDAFTQISALVHWAETADSDSGRVIWYFDISENGTTWYPHRNEGATLDTLYDAGTSRQNIYTTKNITDYARALYGRFRFHSIMPEDTAWVKSVSLIKTYP